MKNNHLLRNKRDLALTIAIASSLISCSRNVNSTQNSAINIDGSSTVYPITKAITDSFKAQKAQAEKVIN